MADLLNETGNVTVITTTSPIPDYVFRGDTALTIIYFLATSIGLPGNILAVLYFVRPCVKRDLSSSLYVAVAVTDVALCFAQLPVIVSIISHREPVLFLIPLICVAWRLLFKSLQRFSVFLVLLLSISRTVSLVRPMTRVRKKAVLGAMYGYVGYILVETATLGSLEGYSYDRTGVYCFENGNKSTSMVYNSLYVTTLGVPAVVIFTSFIISTWAIRRSMSDSQRLSCHSGAGGVMSGDSVKRHATHTIMIFTLNYMVCNLPHFVNMIMWIAMMSLDCKESCYPGPLYNNPFMYWFSWNISEVLSVIVNSAFNPLIYYYRISQYRQWVRVTGTTLTKKVTRKTRRTFSARDTGSRRTADHFTVTPTTSVHSSRKDGQFELHSTVRTSSWFPPLLPTSTP